MNKLRGTSMVDGRVHIPEASGSNPDPANLSIQQDELLQYMLDKRIEPVDFVDGKASYLMIMPNRSLQKVWIKVPLKTRIKWFLSDMKTNFKARVIGKFITIKSKLFGDGKPFHYDIYFYNSKTGERKKVRNTYGYETETDGLFGWTDGNFSCDCNRSICMDIDELPCSHKENIIKIEKIVVRETGEVIAENI